MRNAAKELKLRDDMVPPHNFYYAIDTFHYIFRAEASLKLRLSGQLAMNSLSKQLLLGIPTICRESSMRSVTCYKKLSSLLKTMRRTKIMNHANMNSAKGSMCL